MHSIPRDFQVELGLAVMGLHNREPWPLVPRLTRKPCWRTR